MARKTRLKPLSEQVMVVTGATSGIGLATTREAVERGARVFMIARNEEALRTLAQELRAKGGAVDFAVADVGVERELVAAAERCLDVFGGWDTWVNGAGVTIVGPVRETTVEDQRRLFDTNYWGVVYGSLIAVEHLRAKPGGGALINVGSVVGDAAAPLQAVYSASKHAVKGFTNGLRMDLMRERSPVSVTLVKPSALDSPINEHARNLTDTAIKMPPPVYSTTLAAEAILHCAERRVREITIGGGGRSLTGLLNAVPAVSHPVAARVMPMLYRNPKAKWRPVDDSLHQAGRDGRVRADYGRVRQRSFLTEMQMRPWITVGAALALGVLAGGGTLAGKRLSKRRRERALHEGRRRGSGKPLAGLAALAVAAGGTWLARRNAAGAWRPHRDAWRFAPPLRRKGADADVLARI